MVMRNPQDALKKAPRLFIIILWTGFLVGSLDGLGATINYLVSGNKDAAKLFQFIASGAFGKAAYSGGAAMVFMGVMFHYIVAYLFTVFFFLIAGKIKLLSRKKLLSGILYGIFIWLIMNLLILPLTRIPPCMLHFKPVVIGIAILIIAIGIPLSYIANTYYKKHVVIE